VKPKALPLLACGLLLGIPRAISSQVWVKQSPYPTQWNLSGVAFFPDGRGFICGVDRTLYRALDGGANWQFVNIAGPSGSPFYTVKAASINRIFVLGNNNNAWRSLDAGTNWTQMASMAAGSWSHIDFVAPDVAFAGANGALAKTSNGGASWSVRSGYSTCLDVLIGWLGKSVCHKRVKSRSK
jgi:photosystem II stability/assembly factor-like uncharacterized protein